MSGNALQHFKVVDRVTSLTVQMARFGLAADALVELWDIKHFTPLNKTLLKCLVVYINFSECALTQVTGPPDHNMFLSLFAALKPWLKLHSM